MSHNCFNNFTHCDSVSNHSFSSCRVLMSHLSEDMASEDLNNVKFLLSDTLPRETMENANVRKMNEV